MIIPFILAVFLSYIIDPALTFLTRCRCPLKRGHAHRPGPDVRRPLPSRRPGLFERQGLRRRAAGVPRASWRHLPVPGEGDRAAQDRPGESRGGLGFQPGRGFHPQGHRPLPRRYRQALPGLPLPRLHRRRPGAGVGQAGQSPGRRERRPGRGDRRVDQRPDQEIPGHQDARQPGQRRDGLARAPLLSASTSRPSSASWPLCSTTSRTSAPSSRPSSA